MESRNLAVVENLLMWNPELMRTDKSVETQKCGLGGKSGNMQLLRRTCATSLLLCLLKLIYQIQVHIFLKTMIDYLDFDYSMHASIYFIV